METSLNTWTSIFLIASAQGLFLGILLLLRKEKANSLLGGLVLSFSVLLLFYVAYWTNYLHNIPSYLSVIQGLTYLFGPLAYFYIKSDRNQFYFNPLHFIPFGLYAIHFFSSPFYDPDFRFLVNRIQVIIQITHLAVYVVFIYKVIADNKGYQNGELRLYNWRKKVLIGYTGYVLSFLSYYVLVFTGLLRIEYDYMISSASSLFIYFIGYYGFIHPEVLKQYQANKYNKTSLSKTAAQAVLYEIKKLMIENNLYLESDLKLPVVAKTSGISQHHISQAVNQIEGISFSEFVNNYRVKRACKLIKEQPESKIIEIAYDCGFNNKNSFNNAFKKVTGQSPSQYKESVFVLTQ